MKSKRELSRSELIIKRADGKHECVLCRRVWRDQDIDHQATCVFAQNYIVGIRITGVSGRGIVFEHRGTCWWWTSPASGREYCIEKVPGRYVMTDDDVKEIKTCPNLSSLRLWVSLNQGVL